MIYSVENISFSYPGQSRAVLRDVSFCVEKGEILTILGPNGAGKSTLLKCLIGLLTPDAGDIKLMGTSLASLSERARARLVGFVQQKEQSTFPYTVESMVVMGRSPLLSTFERPGAKDYEAARLAMESLGITELKNCQCTLLSGGEYQQAMIARAVVSNPEAIVFDEPTAHLDVANQKRVLRLMKGLSEKGYSVIVTTHNPDHALLLGGSTALLTRDGGLIKGRADEIVTQEALNQVYNAELLVRYLPEAGRVVCITPNIK